MKNKKAKQMKRKGSGKKERKRKEECGWWDEVRNVCLIDDLPCVLDEGMENCESFETKEIIERRVWKQTK